MKEALTRIDSFKERTARVGVDGHSRLPLGLAHRDRPAEPAGRLGGDRVWRSNGRRAAAATSVKIIRTRSPNTRTVNMMVKPGPDGGMQLTRIPIPPIPDHLKQVIEEQKS